MLVCRFYTEQVITFLLGCIISSGITALTVAMPFLKTKFLGDINDGYSALGDGPKENDRLNKIKLLCYFLVYSLLHVVTMLLVMTMNGWLDLFILASAMLTYFFLYSEQKM